MLAGESVFREVPIEICTENYDEVVLRADALPVLVAFWAPSCGPCQRLAPVLDRLADDLEGAVVIGKVNVDEQAALATAARIRAVPTLHLIRSGKLVDVMLGARSKQQLRERLDLELRTPV